MPPFPLRASNKTVVAATTALTAAYVAGNVISTDEANALCIMFKYVKGDETSIQVKVEATNDPTDTASASINWYQQVTQTASGGTVTLAPAIYSMTAASAASTQLWCIIINPVKGTMYRISTQATGGTPTGTYSINAYTGWV